MSITKIIGGDTGLVASSRVRLARNIKEIPFARNTPQEREQMAQRIWAALAAAPAAAEGLALAQVHPRSMEALRLVEQHLISPALAKTGGWVIRSTDGGVSMMIGEEDHLRLQVIGGGLCPKECLAEAQRLAALLENALPMAYDARLGYLTACPTNVGTGLRASVMLHLPMLAETGGISSVMNWAGRQGCALRGAFGEGSRAQGAFYQLSNQVTLGKTEDELCEKLTGLAAQLIEAEQKARVAVREHDEIALLDRICRAAGVLRNARLLTAQEAEACLSEVLVGLSMQLLGGAQAHEVDQLMQDLRPASLIVAAGADLSARERDVRRATLLRTALGERLTVLPKE